MRKVIRWVVITSCGLLGVLLIAGVVLFLRGGARLNRSYHIEPAAIAIPTDTAAIARGRHLAEAVTLCMGCHGDNLGGAPVIDEPMLATIYASNLTSGLGGVGARYTDSDYVRAIRHGVNADGRGLMIMHSDAYNRLSEADLGAIIAYVKSLSAVDNELPETKGGALGRIMVALGFFDQETMPLIPAEVIDHAAPLPVAPAPAVTSEYGGYLVSIALCAMCHGSDLRGGPPIDEGAPPGPDITLYGGSAGWGPEQFVSTIRTGLTPYGKTLNAEHMPWEVYARMTDDELLAIHQYLAGLARSEK